MVPVTCSLVRRRRARASLRHRAGLTCTVADTLSYVSFEMYEEPLPRWTKLRLAPSQRKKVELLSEQIPKIKEAISRGTRTSRQLNGGTINPLFLLAEVRSSSQLFSGLDPHRKSLTGRASFGAMLDTITYFV